jgi:hypothetical protein
VFRAHSTEFGPWFFASGDGGRFNLREPFGTCYFADDVETAIRESLGAYVEDGGLATRAEVNVRRVSALNLSPGVFADLGDPASVRFDLTREVLTTIDYEVTNAWARAFSGIPVDGIRYASRFTMGPPNSWALFGAAGPDVTRAVAALGTFTGQQACDLAGIRVMDDSIGSDEEITFVKPPTASSR